MELQDIKNQIHFHKNAVKHYSNLYSLALENENILLDPENRKQKYVTEIMKIGREVTVSQVISNLNISDTQKTRRAICNILRQLGYENKVIRVAGKNCRLWVKSKT